MTLGEQKRDLLYISDAIEGLIRAAYSPSAVGRVINLCSGHEICVRDIVGTIYKLVRSSASPRVGAIPYRREEIWNLTGDPSLAKEVLGWEPKVGLEAGLQETIEWFRLYGGR